MVTVKTLKAFQDQYQNMDFFDQVEFKKMVEAAYHGELAYGNEEVAKGLGEFLESLED